MSPSPLPKSNTVDQSSTTSMICCDPNGQSIGIKGNNINANQSGIYTTIMRLASQLDAFHSSSVSVSSSKTMTTATQSISQQSSTSSSNNSNNDNDNSNNNNTKSMRPIISIETEQSVTFLKAYGDHTVVMKVPTTNSKNDNDNIMIDTNESYESQKHDDEQNMNESNNSNMMMMMKDENIDDDAVSTGDNIHVGSD